jgi:hypothetical protein
VYGWRHIWGFRRRPLVAGIVVLVVLAAGVGGYAIAASKGIDVEAVQLAATRSGEERGTDAGRRAGYARGFEATRDRAYQAAYRERYVAAFRNQFEEAGLAAPAKVSVPRP